MQEVDINTLVNERIHLSRNIPNDIMIIGKIDVIKIINKYNELDLSKVECSKIYYWNQEGDSIKNHIFPNSLKELYCSNNKLTSFTNVQLPNSIKIINCANNQLISLPYFPKLLEYLYCSNNKLISLPDLPNSLQTLYCGLNQLTSLPNLPNSLQILYCSGGQLILLPDLPNSLKELNCINNQLISLPNLNKLKIIKCNCTIDYIDYDPNYQEANIKFPLCFSDGLIKLYIEIKDYDRITSNEDYILYMEKLKLSKIKSARK